MSDETAEDRRQLAEKLSEVIQEHALTTPDGKALLLGWVAIVEWKAPDNRRWLSQIGADAIGDELAEWTEQGYLHNALFSGWEAFDDS
jgi:hypothetical protein